MAKKKAHKVVVKKTVAKKKAHKVAAKKAVAKKAAVQKSKAVVKKTTIRRAARGLGGSDDTGIGGPKRRYRKRS